MYATGGVWCQLGATKLKLSLIENKTDQSSQNRVKQPGNDRKDGKKSVLKKVGSTSTSFIGPACRPARPACRPAQTACRPAQTKCRPAQTKIKGKIDKSLSEFYKELEALDAPDSAPRPADHRAPYTDTLDSSEPLNTNRWESDYNPQRSGSDLKRRSQPHWQPGDQDHRDPKRQRPGGDDYWRPQQNRPPCQGRPTGFPPPPRFYGPFPGPPPGHFGARHVNPNWTPYPNPWDSRVPPDRFMCRDPQPPPHPAGDHWGGCSSDTESSNPGVNGGSGRPDAWKWSGDPAWPQSSAPETKPVDLQEGGRTTPDPDSSSSSSKLSLILMRGLPGSGKSTFARDLVGTGPSGLILSSDDYFSLQDGYVYEPSMLAVAHNWNLNRADQAMLEARSPLIIDNTNLQAWEMKPYVTMALQRGYRVYFQEPNTPWKFDPGELEKRNKHGVGQQKISQMLEGFCFPVSVETVMTSQEPPHASGRMQPQQRRP
ncbi:hypothetical protein NHX12_008207 [Muraenolepis orangiensis]|uniref:NEDD4-binding protein 2-like 2 n=1 Tax=Muraenolepis orangiensis TaxID=630683 RepID=A0A9Q0DMK5_9TELE|nr:hypothetical protein NHX12_008207 [Muraenolepis orangiensis]